MTVTFTDLLTHAVAATLVLGAISDVWTARIPNRLIVVGLVLGLLASTVQGGPWGLGQAVLAAGAALGLGLLGFGVGAIGGGDAKFLVVGAALVGWPDLVAFLLASGLCGGLLAVVVVAWRNASLEATVRTVELGKSLLTFGRRGHRNRLDPGGAADPLAVPYGVAIATGALLVHFTPIVEWIAK